jgi:hypothetical protein
MAPPSLWLPILKTTPNIVTGLSGYPIFRYRRGNNNAPTNYLAKGGKTPSIDSDKWFHLVPKKVMFLI